MRSLRWLGVATLIVFLAAPEVSGAPKSSHPQPKRSKIRRAPSSIDNTTTMDVNNLDMVVTNHGSLSYDLETGNAGLIYPKGGTKTAVFAAGLWIGAQVNDTIRCAIGEYSQEFVPGPMADSTYLPDIPEFRNYEIVRGNTTSPDYIDWPVDQGAPIDALGNPLLLGDATIWSVFNDADPNVHTNDAGSTAPLGVEIQQTVFAFNRSGSLGNIIFVKWKILNKGGNTLDSTYVSVWSDPDLGGFTDDLVGCDIPLSLGYCYNATNADQQYGSAPPAVGYDFFRGPIVQVSPGVYDTLGMTSFNKYINGTDPAAPLETYNYMSGVHADGSPIHEFDDVNLPITTYQVSGDPVAASGWLDSNPSDRRLFLSSGPFTMSPGDSQEVVTAIIIGQGSNRLASISDLRNKDAEAQLVFDLNFNIPAPPPAPTVYVQALDEGIRLTWGTEPVGDIQVSTELGQVFKFEGFRIWQMSSNASDADPTVIATFDDADGIQKIYQNEFDPSVGVAQTTVKVLGTDSGLSYSLDITNDAIRGGRLINNQDYYFAVTAFSYDTLNVTPYLIDGVPLGVVSEVLESARTPIQASPRTSSAVFDVVATPLSTGPTNLDGSVVADQLVQNDITGDVYQVTFDDNEHWWLIRTTGAGAPDTLLADQTNLSADFSNPVVDGFMPLVSAPRGVYAIGELEADSSLVDMLPENTDTTGTWYFLDLGSLAAFSFHGATNHDYDIHILPDITEYAWTYGSGEVSFVATYKVPFEIIDLGFNSLDDPSDDVKITAMARDRDLSGSWTWDDGLYFREIPYSSVAWTTPGTKSTDYNPDGGDQTLGRFFFELADTTYLVANPDSMIPPPATIRVLSQKFTSADVYEFRTIPVGTAPGSIVGNDVNDILAVPNPYYAHSAYELTQFDRVLKFTNIPAAYDVTIRIFNMGGDLVRTIQRQASSADLASTATIIWNLNTDNNLPVASGVYIYRVDVQGVGSKTDRIAVFIEQERLDNF